MSLTSKLSIPVNKCEMLLDFIRMILPNDNRLPSSFYLIRKGFLKEKTISFKICSVCNDAFRTRTCEKQSCLDAKSKRFVRCHVSNITTQLRLIVDNYYDSITKYKSKLKIYFINYFLIYFSYSFI